MAGDPVVRGGSVVALDAVAMDAADIRSYPVAPFAIGRRPRPPPPVVAIVIHT